jgi:hypothetical protein
MAFGSMPDLCKIELDPPMFGDPTFHDNDDHVVLSFDSAIAGMFTRTTFVFGIHPSSHDPNSCLQPAFISWARASRAAS